MDEARLKRVYIPVARRVLEEWGLAPAEVAFVHVMENVTLRAERDGQKYALRFHRPGYNTRQEMVSERLWLRALAAAGLNVPHGVPTPDGREFVAVGVDGEERLVGLARWVEGKPLDRILAGTDDVERNRGTLRGDRTPRGGAARRVLGMGAAAGVHPARLGRRRPRRGVAAVGGVSGRCLTSPRKSAGSWRGRGR